MTKQQFREAAQGTLLALEQLTRLAPPEYPIFRNVQAQLHALLRWTEGDRSLTPAEKEAIDVGLIAVRELEDNPSQEIREIADKLKELNLFVDESL